MCKSPEPIKMNRRTLVAKGFPLCPLTAGPQNMDPRPPRPKLPQNLTGGASELRKVSQVQGGVCPTSDLDPPLCLHLPGHTAAVPERAHRLPHGELTPVPRLLLDKRRRTPNTIQRSSGLPLPPQAQSSWTCGLGVQGCLYVDFKG